MERHDVDHIEIRGARVHNLKNIDLDIPLRKLICFSGPSGSGKTSLAFHTLLTESKRRFVNSFPNSLKFFADRPAAVDVDSIYPVLPVFGLPQINPVVGARSVVADIMRFTDSLQNLWFTSSEEFCPIHDAGLQVRTVGTQLLDQMKNKLVDGIYHVLLSPVEFQQTFGDGFIPARSYSHSRKTVDTFHIEDDLWEIIRFRPESMGGMEKKWEELGLNKHQLNYLLTGPGIKKPTPLKFHFKKVCPFCDFESKPVVQVSAFSPYSALGACPQCNGYGANLVYDDKRIIDRELTIQEGGLLLLNYGPFQHDYEQLLRILKKKKIPINIPIKKLSKNFLEILYHGEGGYSGYLELQKYLQSRKYKPSVRIYIRHLQKEVPCQVCSSSRINPNVHHFRINLNGKLWGIHEIMNLTVGEAYRLFESEIYDPKTHEARILTDLCEKLKLALNMGLDHLLLLRKAKSLSAGEYQRLLLIKYLTFKGTDSLFVLDEPSLGLGETELTQLLKGLREIIVQGNTVILIDHSEFVQKKCDHLVVMGPSSGKAGGEIIFEGRPSSYFLDKEEVEWGTVKKPVSKHEFIEVFKPSIYGMSYPDYKLPIHELVWVTGDSGTGKSANIVKILANSLYKRLHNEWLDEVEFKVKSIKSKQKFKDVIVISSELNRFTSRSSVGTITELSSVIRRHFLKLPVSKSMGLKEGHFSSNSELGMCPKCEGKGSIVIEMQYLEDIVLECEECRGLKIRPLYANISDGGMTVAEAYNLPLGQVLERLQLTPKFRRTWDYLKILNLDYLSLDRPLNTLSGGEKQRIYLLSKLLKSIQNSLVVFENLSFGLSEKELKMLGTFLLELLHLNNSLIVIDSSNCFSHLATSRLHFGRNKITLSKLA